jgi:hypothetical protein
MVRGSLVRSGARRWMLAVAAVAAATLETAGMAGTAGTAAVAGTPALAPTAPLPPMPIGDPAEAGYSIYAALRGARPDGRVAAVRGLVIERDAFRIELEAGTVHLLVPVAGRTVGAVFIGRGTLRVKPATEAERRQLALDLGEGRDAAGLSDSFTEMVLLFADDTAAGMARAAPFEQRAPDAQAAAVWEDWFARQRRSFHLNLQLRLARDLINRTPRSGAAAGPEPGAAGRGVFLALCEGKKLPPALIAVDPDGAAGLLRGSRLGGETSLLYVADPRRGGIWYLSPAAHTGGGETAAGTGATPDGGAAAAAQDRVQAPVLSESAGVSAAPGSAGGGSTPAWTGERLAEVRHYRVETTVRRQTDLSGVTTIWLRALSPGLRLLPIDLNPGLRLAEASVEAAPAGDPTTCRECRQGWGGSPPDVGAAIQATGAGEPAPQAAAVIQENAKEDGGDAAVILPRALAKGEEILLRLAYQGDAVLKDAGDKNYYVEARTSWYPNLGVFSDPAPFDLVYQVPAGNLVVSVGRLGTTRQAGGQETTEWHTDGGIRVAGFNYGRFKKLARRDETTGIDFAVFTNPGTPDAVRSLNAAMQGEPRGTTGLLPPGTLYNTAPQASLGVINTARLAEAAMDDAVNAARIFTTYFGPLAERHVAITQQSQFIFGQSWPSLIFLPYISFLDGTQRQRLGLASAADAVDQIGFHELSHQWWGHLVGAATYRDVWLEEGFAEFSAALAVQHTQGWGAYDRFWRAARLRILATPRHSAVASVDAGPITQGFRVATASSPFAYQAIVYSKGAYVLHMLRMLLWDGAAAEPDRRFIEMMHDYTTSFGGRQATTADFQRVVERHMVPAMNAAGDGRMDWFFRQWVYGVEAPRYVTDLHVRTAEGRIHIDGKVRQEGVADDFHAALPIYLEFERHQYVRVGQVMLAGAAEAPVSLTLQSDRKPLGVLVNARGEVLARD